MTPDFIAVAVIAGLAGGAVAAVLMGGVQAWMARGKGAGVEHFTHQPGPLSAVTLGTARSSPGMGPFDRFNESGKRVLALAQREAIRHNHNYIGTEHLLAALLRDGDTVAARALTSLGIELEKVRTALEFTIGRGDQTTSPSDITLSPRTKKVIELAIDESRRMGQTYVGSEHILLGIVREGEGMASGIVESLGATMAMVRAKVLEMLAASANPPPANYTAPPPRREHFSGPFTRFSDRAKRALALAQDEAIRMGHTYIGPEHLLLGVARVHEVNQPDEAIKRILEELGVTLPQLRTELAKVIPRVEPQTPATEIVLSPDTKEILSSSVDESAPDKPVEPEHLLLAIVRDEESVAAQILTSLGATPERVRAAVGR